MTQERLAQLDHRVRLDRRGHKVSKVSPARKVSLVLLARWARKAQPDLPARKEPKATRARRVPLAQWDPRALKD